MMMMMMMIMMMMIVVMMMLMMTMMMMIAGRHSVAQVTAPPVGCLVGCRRMHSVTDHCSIYRGACCGGGCLADSQHLADVEPPYLLHFLHGLHCGKGLGKTGSAL